MTNLILQATQDAIIEFLKEIKGTEGAIEEIEKIYEEMKNIIISAPRYGTGNEMIADTIKNRIVTALKAANAADAIVDNPVGPVVIDG